MTTSSEIVATAPVIASEARVPVEDASFLRAVLEAIPAFVVRLDPEHRIQYINHLRGGVTLEDVIGKPVREFVAPEDFERFKRAVDQALLTGEQCSYIAKGSRAVTRTGAAHYECHAVPIDNGDGRRAVCIIANDVSEQLARAEALAESEEKLRVAVEASGIGLFTWDAATDRLEWNQRLVDIVGFEPKTASEYVERAVHPDDRPRISGALERAAAEQPPFLEHRIVRPDGEVRWVLPCGSVTKGEEGRVVRLTGAVLDVTARRMTEEHLRKAQKLDAIGSLTAGIAHNFNNMLAVIVTALETALKSTGPWRTEPILDAMHAARRATELAGQLMTFAGQGSAPPVAVHDLASILERAISMCQRTIGRDTRIESALHAGGAKVACDPTAIEQVVVNLLINARDAIVEASPDEPLVNVELSEVDAAPPGAPNRLVRYARISVRDNGIGMDDAVKQKLFEPFFTTKDVGKGTGLGLATSYGILREHGGFITIESTRGTGTIATMYLPLADPVGG